MIASLAKDRGTGTGRTVDTPFGTVAVDAATEISFPSGIPGFEACRRFVVLSPDELGGFSCLHSLEGPAASFLVIDPRRVVPQYRCAVNQSDLARLCAAPDTVLLWLALVSFDADGQAYANLRAPIVVNPERMLGYQVMPHNSLYPLRHPLASE
jgi:flagellar assembly factor FliW